MSHDASVADLLAFDDLPEETQSLARRVLFGAPNPDRDEEIEELESEVFSLESDKEDALREARERLEELGEFRALALPAFRFAHFAIRDRAALRYWSDGDLEEKLAEAGLLRAVDVDAEKTGCARPDDCPCEEGDRCFRATEAGLLTSREIHSLEEDAKARLERKRRDAAWTAHRRAGRLLSAAVDAVCKAAGKTLELASLERARATSPEEPHGSPLHLAAVVALLHEADPTLAETEITVAAPEKGGLVVTVSKPAPLEVVR